MSEWTQMTKDVQPGRVDEDQCKEPRRRGPWTDFCVLDKDHEGGHEWRGSLRSPTVQKTGDVKEKTD